MDPRVLESPDKFILGLKHELRTRRRNIDTQLTRSNLFPKSPRSRETALKYLPALLKSTPLAPGVETRHIVG